MTRMLKTTRNTETNTSAALFDTGSSYQVELATLGLDRRQIIEEIEYEGLEDKLAARAMAHGAWDSIRSQIRDGIIEA